MGSLIYHFACFFSQSSTFSITLFFHFSWPHAAIEKSGQIYVTRCTCEVRNGGKCCHIGSLLFMLDDISCERTPLFAESTTDTSCYWETKGIKRKKDPRPIHLIPTGKKCRLNNRLINIDPCPQGSSTTKFEVANFLVEANTCKCNLKPCSCSSNWIAKKVYLLALKLLQNQKTRHIEAGILLKHMVMIMVQN